jgi:hypothetical protein
MIPNITSVLPHTEMRRQERVRERRAREGMKRVTQRKASSGLTL